MKPDDLCGLLAEPERLRAYAAVVLGAGSPGEVAAAAGMPVREAERALRRLARGGLLGDAEGRLAADAGVFKEAVRAAAGEQRPADPLDPDPRRDTILRAFISAGRLERMPAAAGKRLVVLEHIATTFEPGVRYPESAVNALLRAWYDDHASLRRYLVDEGLLTRDQGMYWRSGGPVDIGPA